jgi:hypothetical protein
MLIASMPRLAGTPSLSTGGILTIEKHIAHGMRRQSSALLARQQLRECSFREPR